MILIMRRFGMRGKGTLTLLALGFAVLLAGFLPAFVGPRCSDPLPHLPNQVSRLKEPDSAGLWNTIYSTNFATEQWSLLAPSGPTITTAPLVADAQLDQKNGETLAPSSLNAFSYANDGINDYFLVQCFPYLMDGSSDGYTGVNLYCTTSSQSANQYLDAYWTPLVTVSGFLFGSGPQYGGQNGWVGHAAAPSGFSPGSSYNLAFTSGPAGSHKSTVYMIDLANDQTQSASFTSIKGTPPPTMTANIGKFYEGSTYMYMQTNTAESLAMQSPVLTSDDLAPGVTSMYLHPGDRITVQFYSNSLDQVLLNLECNAQGKVTELHQYEVVPASTSGSVPSSNLRTAQITLSDPVGTQSPALNQPVNQIEFSGTFQPGENFKLVSLVIEQPSTRTSPSITAVSPASMSLYRDATPALSMTVAGPDPIIDRSSAFIQSYTINNAKAISLDFAGTTVATTVPSTGLQVGGGLGYSDGVISGNLAYMVGEEIHGSSGWDGLSIYDITSPAAPTLVGSLALGYGSTIALLGSHAYVAYMGGFSDVDVSHPAAPVTMGSLSLPMDMFSSVFGVEVAVLGGRTCAVVTYSGALVVIDLSTLTIIGSVAVPCQGGYERGDWLAVSGNTAYVTSYSSGLIPVDLSDPTTPQVLPAFLPPGASYVEQVVVDGTRAYVAGVLGSSPCIFVLDVSLPSSPRVLSSYNVGSIYAGSIVSVRYASGLLFVGMDESQLPLYTGYVLVFDVAPSGVVALCSTDVYPYAIPVTGREETTGAIPSPDGSMYVVNFFTHTPSSDPSSQFVSVATAYSFKGGSIWNAKWQGSDPGEHSASLQVSDLAGGVANYPAVPDSYALIKDNLPPSISVLTYSGLTAQDKAAFGPNSLLGSVPQLKVGVQDWPHIVGSDRLDYSKVNVTLLGNGFGPEVFPLVHVSTPGSTDPYDYTYFYLDEAHSASVDAGTWNAWYDLWTQTLADGNYLLQFQACDVLGNSQNEFSIGGSTVSFVTVYKDTVGPTFSPVLLSNTPSTAPYFSGPPHYSVTITDATSGVINHIDNPDVGYYAAYYSIDGNYDYLKMASKTFDPAKGWTYTFQDLVSSDNVWSKVPEGTWFDFYAYAYDYALNFAEPVSFHGFKDSVTPILGIPSISSPVYENPPLYQFTVSSESPYSVSVKADSGDYYLPQLAVGATGSSVVGLLPAGFWGSLGYGPHSLTFLVTDSAGNAQTTTTSPVTKLRSLDSAPISAGVLGGAVFGPGAPQYAISGVEYPSEINHSALWVSYGDRVNHYAITQFTGVLPQAMWSKLSNGTNTIWFHLESIEGVIVEKSVVLEVVNVGPIINIISPLEGNQAGATAPWISLSIQDVRLDSVLYSLDGGKTKFPVSINNLYFQVDQTAWDNAYNQTVTVTIYARNSYGLWSSVDLTLVRSDWVNKAAGTHAQRGDGIDFGLFYNMAWQVAVFLVAVFAVVMGMAIYLQKRSDKLAHR